MPLDYFTAYSVTSLLVSFTSITIGLIVLFTNPKITTYRVWFLLSIAVALSGLGWAFRDLSTNEVTAYFWGGKVLYTSIIFVPAFFFHFVLSILGEKKLQKKLILSYSIAILLWIINSFTKLVVIGMAPKFSFKFFTVPGPLSPAVFLYFAVTMFYSNWLLFAAFKSSDGQRRNQLKYLFLSTFIAFLGGLSSYLPIFKAFNNPIFSYCNGLIIFFSVISAYAILKYKLMDFNLLARWGLAYGILLTSLIVCVGVLFTIIQKLCVYLEIGMGIPSLIIVCALVFIIDPLRKKIAYFVDMFIFKCPDFEFILTDLNRLLQQSNDLNSLAFSLSNKLRELWSIDHSGIVIWNSNECSFDPLPKENFKLHPISRIQEKIGRSDFLIRTLESEKRLFKYGIIFEDELTALGNRTYSGERTTFWKIRRTMRWLGVAACVPLLWQDNLLGFIALGPKKNHGIYNNEDKKFLSHLASIVSTTLKELIWMKSSDTNRIHNN